MPTDQIIVRVSRTERERIERAAEIDRRSRNQFLRVHGLEKAERVLREAGELEREEAGDA
ncbi:MAG: DUF1778 domain-containing protein [Bacteroidota bacterium]